MFDQRGCSGSIKVRRRRRRRRVTHYFTSHRIAKSLCPCFTLFSLARHRRDAPQAILSQDRVRENLYSFLPFFLPSFFRKDYDGVADCLSSSLCTCTSTSTSLSLSFIFNSNCEDDDQQTADKNLSLFSLCHISLVQLVYFN